MKTLSSLIFLLLFQFHLNAQPCPLGVVTLSNQASVDDFAINYPNCTVLPSNLTIQGNINNLNGLSQITQVNGTVQIRNTTALVNLSGLDNLERINGSLWFDNNQDLINLTGLDNLTTVGNSLFIENSPNLISLSALGNLTEFNSDLVVAYCDALTTLDGLEGLSSSPFILIGLNPSLVSIAGLNGMIPGSIGFMGIEDNAQLSVCNEPFLCNSLNGTPFLFATNNAPGCNSVNEILVNCPNEITCPPTGLTINSQEDIDNFVAQYPDCTQLPASLVIESPSITNLDGLEQLVSTNGVVYIQNNNLLENLNGLQNFIASNSGFRIDNNDALTNLSGLNSLQNIQGRLMIRFNENLSDLSALNNINVTSIQEFEITDNPSLSTCTEAFICTLIEDGYSGTLSNNGGTCNSISQVGALCSGSFPCPLPDLNFSSQQDIDNFLITYNACTSVNGTIVISGSDINNLSPLSAITSFNGNLVIESNPILTSINGIENLLDAANGIYLENNNVLTDISALNGIDLAANITLVIKGNTVLSTCTYSNICTYFSNSHNFNSSILNNAGTCASELLLLADCTGGETCPSGDLIFNSQGAVDSFLLLYPTCTEITGDVRLAPMAGIQNLNGLQRIETITGDLRITKNSTLSELGLTSLESVGGKVKIENTDLQNFEGLENLIHIGGYLRIGYNTDLLTLNGLENLTTIPRLKIEFNPLLNNLNGLSNVNTIDGYLKIRSNASLLSLHGLANVSPDEITELEIINNTSLVLCDQNNICTYIGTDKTRTIFNNSNGCNTEVEIEENCANTSCGSTDLILETQEEIDNFALNYPDCIVWSANLSIQGSDITNLNGLSQLIAVEGNLNIEDTGIPSLSGLEQLIVIYGDFLLLNNNTLSSIEETPSIGGSLVIQNNELLSNCGVESVCYHIYIGGDADISNNALGCESTNAVETACNATVYVCASINSSANDAEEKVTGAMNLGSSDLEMVMDANQQIIGLRFLQLNIPNSANIQEANIQFTSDQTDNQNPCQLNIYGELSGNPLPFSNSLFNISNRTKTAASVLWTPPNWDQKNERGPAQKTVDISTILQEIVNQPAYTQNDPIVILIDGMGKRTADSYDGTPDGAAQLCLTYTENTAPASEYNDRNNNTITSNEKYINVYPNPTNGLLQVDLTAYSGEAAAIQIRNSLGVLVLTELIKEIPTGPTSLQLSHLPKGLYWISVKIGKGDLENVRVLFH